MEDLLMLSMKMLLENNHSGITKKLTTFPRGLTSNMGTRLDPVPKQDWLAGTGDCDYDVGPFHCLFNRGADCHRTLEGTGKVLCTLLPSTPHTDLYGGA